MAWWTVTRSRSAHMAELKRNSLERWYMIALPEWGCAAAYCECGCGQTVTQESEVHHVVAAGKGRRRDHSVENLRYVTRECHNEIHAGKKTIE